METELPVMELVALVARVSLLEIVIVSEIL
jgi:hypothetical protein